MISTHLFRSRNMVLTVLSVLLLLSAGCNGLGVGETEIDTSDRSPESSGTQAHTSTVTTMPTSTATPTPDPEATDLRQIEVQSVGSELYTTNTRGEIDRGDPRNNQGYYEPVTFRAQANDTITVSMRGIRGDPSLELRAPNGTVLETDDDGGVGETATIDEETVPTTGRYTIIAAGSAERQPSTFEYLLRVNRAPRESETQTATPTPTSPQNDSGDIFMAGNATTWNETEQYTNFAYDFGTIAQDEHTDVEQLVMVNPEQDYVVLTLIDGPHYNASQRQLFVGSLAYTNVNVYEGYVHDEIGVVNDSWAPDRVYIRFVTPEKRGVYRITALTKRAALMNISKNDTRHRIGPSIDDYFFRKHVGPASSLYADAYQTVENLSDYPGIDRESEVTVPPLTHANITNTTNRTIPNNTSD